MAKIKPFLCIRPAPELAGRIAALPYDVYDRREAKAEVTREPLSFLRIDRAETQFEDNVDIYGPQVYQAAHDLLWRMVEEGQLIRERQEKYFVYELTMDGRVQDGLMACASIDDYLAGVIRKHENTREEKEQDRIRHIEACSAHTGPIFLAYRAQEKISRIIAGVKGRVPLYDFTSNDNIRHRVFPVDLPEEMESLGEAFGKMGEIYIADGHHRAASAVKAGLRRREENPGYTGEEEFNYFLAALFADEQLMIMDYNRVVKDLNGYSAEGFLHKVGEIFDVSPIEEAAEHGLDRGEEAEHGLDRGEGAEHGLDRGEEAEHGSDRGEEAEHGSDRGENPEAAHPRRKGEFSMYLAGRWHRCRVREADLCDDPVEGLDVSLLQRLLLEPVLGIADPRTDQRIDFVGGVRGLGELARRVSEDCAVAFAMYPTSIQELFAVADEGKLMPPKSTWFEPKLRSGLFIHEI